MLRGIITSILLVLSAGVLAACAFGMVIGSGKSVTETRAVSDFDAVDFAFIGDLVITQGEEESLTITGDDNIVDLIRTTVRDGVLRIDAGSASVGQTRVPLRYALTVKNLASLSLSGLGNITADKLASDNVTLSLSGAGAVTIGDLKADTLAVTMSGLGNANLTGEVNKQAVDVSGAGSYYAGELRSQAATVTISGLGNAEVWVVETLAAKISGAGSIRYRGAPQVTETVSGLGDIEAMASD